MNWCNNSICIIKTSNHCTKYFFRMFSVLANKKFYLIFIVPKFINSLKRIEFINNCCRLMNIEIIAFIIIFLICVKFNFHIFHSFIKTKNKSYPRFMCPFKLTNFQLFLKSWISPCEICSL